MKNEVFSLGNSQLTSENQRLFQEIAKLKGKAANQEKVNRSTILVILGIKYRTNEENNVQSILVRKVEKIL